VRVLLQRVERASVQVEGVEVGQIGRGLLIFAAVGTSDTTASADYLAAKIPVLRLFDDVSGRPNLSLTDIGGDMLVVSQFTLYADCRKGRRPSFDQAAPPAAARVLYDYFVAKLSSSGLKVATGVFQAEMKVSLTNDGPFTVICESPSPDVTPLNLTQSVNI
jgi:D-tyrosyl-tRNA(Tyr) deacylase